MKEKALSDEDAARRVQAGETEAFGLLVERYEERLKRYGRKFLAVREDIEDMVQEVFMRAFENIQEFDAAQRFSPWVYRIAHNVFINHLKKTHRMPFVSLDLDAFFSFDAKDEAAERERERAEMKQVVDRGLGELAPKYREVLVLHYLEELSYREIAEVLQVPTGTVGVRLSRAKEVLKKTYQGLNIDYGN